VTGVEPRLLDIRPAGQDGFTLLNRFRGRGGEQAVALLTAANAVEDRVHGLTLRRDDTWRIPSRPMSCWPRVSALSRRGARSAAPVGTAPLTIDRARKRP